MQRKQRRFSVSAQLRACELIYDTVKTRDGTVSEKNFCEQMSSRGILSDDPRLAQVMNSFTSAVGANMPKQQFLKLVKQDVKIIERAFTNSNVIPQFEKFALQIRELFHECASNVDGKLTDATPQLCKQNPNHFAVSLCTVSGQRLKLGNTDVDFTLHSCEKPISYCMAMEEHGMDVHKHVGHEPSGLQGNALKLMENGLPHNPLINAGAIMTCALIQQNKQPADKFDYVLDTWSLLTGGVPMNFNNSIYLSLKKNSDREHALAHFLKENGVFPPKVDIDLVLQFYFQCAAISTNSNYLSIVAGSLANGGVCPLTNQAIFSPETVKHCLSMMFSCGMSDYSGEFAFSIGLPACSGESGAIMVVIPNVMGIVTYSPLLDVYGNSTRGVEFISRLTQKYNFHMFDHIDKGDNDKEDPIAANCQEEVTVEKIIRFSSLGDIGALKRLQVDDDHYICADCDFRTPLHLAASNGHLAVVKFIIEEVGVENVNPVDRWSGTPYDDAIREGFFDVVTFLQSVGGKRGVDLVERKREHQMVI